MNIRETDLLIVGAGPVGLMSSYLANQSGIKSIVLDKTKAPLEVGRADALNARSLQFLELANLFKELYPLGKICKTSSVWKDGEFQSRQSSWWDELEGCYHKHFLMIGQSYLEKLLDQKLQENHSPVLRSQEVTQIEMLDGGVLATLKNGEKIKTKYLIGADGAQSMVRRHFSIPFIIERPQITWAVIDAEIETDFKKVSEIIVFQAETSDVAWIPREGKIDRFYVRMDRKNFSLEDTLAKVNRAISPFLVEIKKLIWFSQFSVKESVAENFFVKDRVFLAGDACHIHSVNGGQGLNTGLADAFNLIWKISRVLQNNADKSLLDSYESERKPVALSVIESSGELVRSTKYSSSGTHAEDYVKIVEKRSGNITGMGHEYQGAGLVGSRLHDFEIIKNGSKTRVYSMLDYSRYTLLVFGKSETYNLDSTQIQVIEILNNYSDRNYAETNSSYYGQAILVRPDSYIAAHVPIEELRTLLKAYKVFA